MIVNVIRPNVVEYRLRAETSDLDYQKCLWAHILINHDTYTISAQSDCGGYSYSWPVTEKESFLDVLLRALKDEEYLLGKFSKRTKFSLSETKRLFFELNDADDMDDPAIKAVQDIDARTEEDWIYQMREMHLDDAPWDYIVREYPAQAHTFVKLLTHVILPLLKEEKERGA